MNAWPFSMDSDKDRPFTPKKVKYYVYRIPTLGRLQSHYFCMQWSMKVWDIEWARCMKTLPQLHLSRSHEQHAHTYSAYFQSFLTSESPNLFSVAPLISLDLSSRQKLRGPTQQEGLLCSFPRDHGREKEEIDTREGQSHAFLIHPWFMADFHLD